MNRQGSKTIKTSYSGIRLEGKSNRQHLLRCNDIFVVVSHGEIFLRKLQSLAYNLVYGKIMVFSVYPDSPDYSTDDYFNGIPTGYFADNHDLTSNSTSMEYFSYTSDRMEHLYLLDFDSGRVIKLNSQNVKKLLITDPSMYNEYLSLPVFDQKEHLFDHIVKFNQKNSLNLASA